MTWERDVFNTRSQSASETIEEYVTALKLLSKTCEFGDLADSLVKDRLVCGIRDDQIRARLLREPALTLQKAVDIGRASEASTSQIKQLTQQPATVEVHSATVRSSGAGGARQK